MSPGIDSRVDDQAAWPIEQGESFPAFGHNAVSFVSRGRFGLKSLENACFLQSDAAVETIAGPHPPFSA